MNKKLITLLLALGALTQSINATNGLWLEKRDGRKIGYVFDQNVTISYTYTSIVLTEAGVTAEYPFEDVKRIYFDEGVVSGIEAPSLSSQQIRIMDNGVSLRGFDASTPVTVYDFSGRIVSQMTTDANGSLQLMRSTLPPGANIIKVGKSTIKYINK